MSETDSATADEPYVEELDETLGRCSIWSDGRVYVPKAKVEEYDLRDTLADIVISWGEDNSVPLTDAQVSSKGLIRVPKRTRERYGVPTGPNQKVTLTIKGVHRD